MTESKRTSSLPILYREEKPSPEFDSEEEEFEALRAFIQEMMGETTRESTLDSILMLINICEMRANFVYGTTPRGNWYTDTANVLRTALAVISHLPQSTGPDIRLEAPDLYWPDMETH